MQTDTNDVTKLREFIVNYFDWEELRTLCQDLTVDFDSLRGEGKEGKARELVAYVERHSRLSALKTALGELRGDAWNESRLDKLSKEGTQIKPRSRALSNLKQPSHQARKTLQELPWHSIGVVVVIIAILVVTVTWFRSKMRIQLSPEASPNSVVVVHFTPTLTPTPTSTPPSTATFTPAPTFTPSPPPTVTSTSTPPNTASPIPTPTPSVTATPNGVLIDDFENRIDGWFAARAGSDEWRENEVAVSVSLSPDAAAGNSALQCDFDFGLTDEYDPRATFFLVDLPTPDWTEYHALQFQAKSLVDLSHNVRVFIALATRGDSCWNELGDFQTLESDYQTFTFDLDRALFKTCERFEEYDQVLLGKDHVTRLHLIFAAEHEPSGAVLVDEIWLLKP